jgi:hypothetical protein
MPGDVFIETDRLILRTVTMDDIEDLALTWRLDEGVISHVEAKKHILRMLDNHEKNTFANFIKIPCWIPRSSAAGRKTGLAKGK